MQIIDQHFRKFVLPSHVRLSDCHLCQRMMIPCDPKREEISSTMHYRAMGLIAERANTRAPNERPWCRECRQEHFEKIQKAKVEAGGA